MSEEKVALDDVTVEEAQVAPTKAPDPKPGYSDDEKGVWFTEPKDGVKHYVCSPLKVMAHVRDNRNENWGRLLSFTDPDGHRHVWAMPMELLRGTGDELRGILLGMGLTIAPGNAARKRLEGYISTSATDQRARCVDRTGWHGNAFVLPDKTIGKGQEMVVYQAPSATPTHYSQKGTLDGWRQNVSAFCVGNSRLITSMSAAFASALLRVVGIENGGLHFFGPSSSGKTTLLFVAASAFGPPEYLCRWRATSNGLEGLASLHNDALLILDEMGQVDPREAGETAYLLANGTGKARSRKDGTVKPRSVWRLIFLSAGEITLADHMREGGKRAKAGQEVRLADIPADAGRGMGVFENLHGLDNAQAFADMLKHNAAQHYGTAFVEYVGALALNLDKLPALVQEAKERFLTDHMPSNAGGQVGRVCSRFALIAAGGELATKLGITGWPEGEAVKAAGGCFRAWCAARGGSGDMEIKNLLSQVRQFFQAHGESRFSSMTDTDPRMVQNRAGFKRLDENKETEFFVLSEMFKEVCQGHDSRWAAKVLTEAGWLQQGADGKTTSNVRLPGMGQKRCYHFTRKVWDVSE